MKKYYFRFFSVKVKKIVDIYIFGELVTLCRFFLVLIIFCFLIVGIFVSVSQIKVSKILIKSGEILVDVLYQFDFSVVLRVREENLELYQRFQYLWIVEKRLGLIFEEFWDIYDGKW